MGFLGNLFCKERNNERVPVTLDLCDDGIILNGVALTFPTRASDLIKILGEPRIAENQSMKEIRELHCKKYHFDPDTYCPRDYYWDNEGLIARTHEHETVHTMLIYFRKSKYPFPMPKHGFSGTLLINGRPYMECIKREGGLVSGVLLRNSHLFISRHGRGISEKVVVIQLCLNDDVELKFFE